MVSFSCEECGDVLTKKKLDPHRNRCRSATFTCIDCMVHFPGVQYRFHTSCMTEDQKYQGALYKDKSKKPNNNNSNNNTPKYNHTATNNNANNNANNNNDDMAHNAYVEDCGEDREYDWAEYEGPTEDEKSPSEPPPEAPTPPSAHEDHVDVFEFLVATGQTPNASNMNLTGEHGLPDAEHGSTLVRYEPPKEALLDPLDPNSYIDEDALVQYGAAPVPSAEFVTPAPKHVRRKSREGSEKKDKKRKRLHVDVPTDQEMTDAPPHLHTGLTGGLNRMMRPIFPPSPDYSGGDAPEVSPASPLKKSKHTKHSKHAKQGQVTNSIFGMIAGTKTKTKVKTKSSKTKKPKSSSSSSKKHKEKTPQLIEYRPHSKDGKAEKDEARESQVILYKPRADMFLSFVTKGPESERGCSMNKVLKRFHRERQASGAETGKGMEEKELWRSLRLRQNERGEIVLFSV
ncbi:hypothetical protein BGZ61DRAFT_470929 [Ilyonectria robusta]|uniref:uncharacterized protein n=1 Tax=Ilyonectria robusta TaxID=1079257 RepID=UPI001E8E939E|nr:uncharacterized protein BGZ61DRAFT_470929 [Ilyonectria robusta]KAH8737501.1 hypothetical protein BGZ61DRAFT_470929 [Ilyonectria robusta]